MNFEIFEKTIKLCEKVLGKFPYDYKEVFEFSKTYYVEIPESLLKYINENENRFKKGSYESDLIRYVYIKYIENRIASDFFSQTSRGNVCDVFFSPEDLNIIKENICHFIINIFYNYIFTDCKRISFIYMLAVTLYAIF